MAFTPTYIWKCNACDAANPAGSATCSTCSCPAKVSSADAEKYLNKLHVGNLVAGNGDTSHLPNWFERALETRTGKMLGVPFVVGAVFCHPAWPVYWNFLGMCTVGITAFGLWVMSVETQSSSEKSKRGAMKSNSAVKIAPFGRSNGAKARRLLPWSLGTKFKTEKGDK